MLVAPLLRAVLETDFQNLMSLDLPSRTNRNNVKQNPWDIECESMLEPLIKYITKDTERIY
jgi:hypothetical protein